MSTHAEEGGRASRKGAVNSLARPRYQEGSVIERRGKHGKVWVLRWRQDILQADGSLKRVQRAETVRGVTKLQTKKMLQARVSAANQGQRQPKATMRFSDFVETEWRPNAELDLKKGSVRYYSKQLDNHVLPALGATPLCDVTRARIEACLSDLRRKNYASATIRGVRATLMTVL